MESSYKLTKYPEGSIRELWTISLPLMLSILATLLMVFVDRCFLAHYSLEALNATVTSGTVAWAFLGSICTLAAMSEVFVSQYNGANKKHLIGNAVWQMIWVALLSSLLFFSLNIWAENILSTSSGRIDLQANYFKTLIVFGPAYALISAFSGFFIGRGKTKLLVVLAISSNLLNAALDWVFIFGIPELCPEMGVFGAALATGIGASFQALILGILFFRKKNRDIYGTNNWKFNDEVFRKSLKVGIPPALNVFLEIIGWAVFYVMMTSLGKEHITISSICQSLIILFSFYHEGLSRGIIAVVGNLIGANKSDSISKVVRSGYLLFAIFLGFIFILLGFYPDQAVLFFGANELLQEAPGQQSIGSITPALKTCLLLTAVYMIFEGVRWIFSGVLTAAGDTFFILVMGAVSVWAFLLFPLYFIVVRNNLSVEIAWVISVLFAMIVCLFFGLRYAMGKWKRIELIKNQKPETISEP